MPEERRLVATSTGLRFSIPPGTHWGDECDDPRVQDHHVSPQQLISGFTFRRGTWAARLRLGSLPDPADASAIHAFWLLSPAFAEVSGARVSNEIDHEWNNYFLGADQAYPYVATGAARGTPEGGRKAPMSSPLAAPVLPQPGVPTDPLAWTCRHRRGTEDQTLAPEACSALLRGQQVSELPQPQEEVFATLTIHVSDEGIRFSLASDGWSGRIEMRSALLTPATQAPLAALLSQHLFPARGIQDCHRRAVLRTPMTFEVDWFLYADAPDLSAENAEALVRQIRQQGVSRLATASGVELERPDRPLVGWSGRWGYGAWTTPLSLSLDAPRAMAPGEAARLYAGPPRRHGTYRYTWTVSTRYASGRYETTTHDDAFALPFTFAEGARTVLVRVRLEELDDEGEVVHNETVQPVERVFTIRRR